MHKVFHLCESFHEFLSYEDNETFLSNVCMNVAYLYEFYDAVSMHLELDSFCHTSDKKMSILPYESFHDQFLSVID